MKKLFMALMLAALSTGALGVGEAQSLAATRHARPAKHSVTARKHTQPARKRVAHGRKSIVKTVGKVRRSRKGRSHKAKKVTGNINPMPIGQ